ncbi:MAG: hypothetical protein IJ869_07095 [Clostridiales bacterium]|nr:hypothetical protein [Clostridiales bacterium]
MNNLIKAEKYKLFHNFVFWALLIGMTVFGFMGGSGYRMNYLAHNYDPIEVTSFSGVFNAMVADSLFLLVAVCAMLGWFMGREFSARWIASEVAAGHKRSHIFLSKTLVNVIAYNIVMIVYPLAGAISQISYFGIGDLTGNILNILRTCIYMFLLQSAFFFITIMIAFLMRSGIKTAIAAPVVSFAIALLFANGVEHHWNIATLYFSPIYRLREVTAMGSQLTSTGLILVPALATALLWIGGCSMIIWKSFSRSDLK